jgi:hypothetical protein
MINTSTKKSLYELVKREINSSKNAGTALSSQLTKNGLVDGINSNVVANADNIANLKSILQSTITPRILVGLEVYATSPASSSVIINAGKGTIGGAVFTLENTTQVQIPLRLGLDVFYINLSSGYITVDSSEFDEKLTIAKIVKQSQSATIVTDIKDSNLNAYIINYKTIDLRVDKNNQFEEDTQQIFRDNIGEILADNLIGNIRLSENLKVLNTQGSIELDSNSLKVRSSDDKILSKLNRDGTYFYDTSGIEVARFTRNDARIGNMLVDKSSIGSANFQSGLRGFKIQDDGKAEFEDVKIRGTLSSTVFEQDTVSAVGGSLFVGKSTTLRTNILSTDNTITFNDAEFTNGDIVLVKDTSRSEYIKINSIPNGTSYTVIRGLNGTAYDWNSGITFVSTGNEAGSGYIMLTASDNYSPYLDVVTRSSECYCDYSTNVRLGNLSGITDPDYGALLGYGLYADNVYLKGKLRAPDIKTAESGSRVELNSDGLYLTDINNNYIFSAIANNAPSGFNVGDLIIGDINTNNYMYWDTSTCTLRIRGDLAVGMPSVCKLSDLSSDLGTITAGHICGSTISTIDQYGKTIFNSNGIYSYDTSDRLTFCLYNGKIAAEDIKLVSPSCSSRYTCISSGEFVYVNEYGLTPYVKKIESGTVKSGTTVTLTGWQSAPKILTSLNSITSYNKDYSGQSQVLVATNPAPVYYNNITSMGHEFPLCCMTSCVPLYACNITGGQSTIKLEYTLTTEDNVYFDCFCNHTLNTTILATVRCECVDDNNRINTFIDIYNELNPETVISFNMRGYGLYCFYGVYLESYGNESSSLSLYNSPNSGCYTGPSTGETYNYFSDVLPVRHTAECGYICFNINCFCTCDVYELLMIRCYNNGSYTTGEGYIDVASYLPTENTSNYTVCVPINLGFSLCAGESILLNAKVYSPDYCYGGSSLCLLNLSQPSNHVGGFCCKLADVRITCDYGYNFTPSLVLSLSAGYGSEICSQTCINSCFTTYANTLSTTLKNNFQLWCNNNAPSNYYYGTLTYNIYYRLFGATPWCCFCNFSYIQPHGSTSELKSTQTQVVCVQFPCAGQWDVKLCQTGLSFTDSNICATTTTCGSSCYTGSDGVIGNCYYTNGNRYGITCRSWTFLPPSGTYCTIFSWGYAPYVCAFAGGTYCGDTGYAYIVDCNGSIGVCDSANTLSTTCKLYPTQRTFSSLSSISTMSVNTSVCAFKVSCSPSASAGICDLCVCGISATYYWCQNNGASSSCNVSQTYSHLDYLSSGQILDSGGYINWIAIGY